MCIAFFFGLYTSSSSIHVLTLFICLHFSIFFFHSFLSTLVSIRIDFCMHYVNPIHPKKIWLFVVYIKFFGLQFESKREEKKKRAHTHQIYNESAFSMQRTTISVENGTKLILSCNSIPQYLISVKVCIPCCMHIYCLYLSSAFFCLLRSI